MSTIGDVTTIPAGWYPDPENNARSRWWNGTAWTASVSEPQPAPPQEPFVPQVAVAPQQAVAEPLPFVASEPLEERETAQPFNPQQSELQRLLSQATPPSAPVAGALTRRQLRELTSGGGASEPTPVVPTAQIPAPTAAPGTPFGDVAVMPAANSYTPAPAAAVSFDDILAGKDAAAEAAPAEVAVAPTPIAEVSAPTPNAEPAPMLEEAAAPEPVPAPVAAPAPAQELAVQPVPYVEPPMPTVNPYSQPVAAPVQAALPAAPGVVLTPEPLVPGLVQPATQGAPGGAPVSGPISVAALFSPVPTSGNAFGAAPVSATPNPAPIPGYALPATQQTTNYAPLSGETSRPLPVIASLLPTSTLAIWLFALFPLILSVGLIAAFLSFDVLYSVPAPAFGAIAIVFNLLFASSDKKKLESLGHLRGVSPWWSLLPLVFLIIRTARLGGRSVAPLIAWVLANAASGVVAFYGVQMIFAQMGLALPF